ncbi:MAG: glycosyltransferase, partial [bacterium]
VYQTLAQYDVLILPTFWKGEGYPGVIIEAFMVNLPVIATSLKGIKEIVQDGKTGLLVEPRSIESLKNAILKLHSDKKLYKSLVQNIKKEKFKYSNEYWAKIFIHEIQQLIKG